MATTFFPDISHYQTGLNLKGAPAVIAKATEGSTFRDPAYAGFTAQAATLGIPFAAYHWLNTVDLAAQAANAFAVARSTPLMWDCEAAGATVPRILDITTRYRNLGGIATLCYLPRWWWQQLGSPDLRPLAAAGLAIVSSNYPAAGYTEAGPGWTAYGGVTPTIWQYTSSQPFNGQTVDFNAYRGSVDQLRTLFNHGQEADMALSEEEHVHFMALIWRVEALINNRPVVAGGPLKGEVNRLAVAVAAANDDPITPAQLAELVAAVKTGAEQGVAEALDGVTATTVIHAP